VDFSQIDLAFVLISMAVLLFSLSVHESAHAWTADYFGDYTARYLGRVSLNPIVHIDLVGTVLFPLIGMFTGFIFGWAKPVPVNTSHLRNPRRDHLFIAAAGPASNILLAIGFLIGLNLILTFGREMIVAEHPVIYPLALLCQIGLFLNVVLAVFNLLPIPPLDGSWIMAGIMPEQFSSLMDTIRPYGFVLLILLLYTGVHRLVLYPVMEFIRSLIV
jgi:Zn-dependent protease